MRSTPIYAPPEVQTHPIIHGNACDVWSLGCLYLEFITWYFGGKQLPDEFKAARDQDTCYVTGCHDQFFAIVAGAPGEPVDGRCSSRARAGAAPTCDGKKVCRGGRICATATPISRRGLSIDR